MNHHRPNILLITLDECRQDALSCYGQPAIRTPNMDRIGETGIKFTDAFAPSPLCLPGRCSLLSGQYPHRHGAYSNFRQAVLDPARPNLYNLLKHAGYHTAHAGKCHYKAVPYHLMRQDATVELAGIREYILSLGLDHLDLCDGKAGAARFWDDYSRELAAKGYLDAYREALNDKVNNQYCFAFPGPADWHPDAWVGRKAIEHVQGYEPASPFFLWCSFGGPHYPQDPPQAYLDRVDEKNIPPIRFAEGEFDGEDKIQAAAFHGTKGWYMLAEGAQCAPDRGLKTYTEKDWRRLRRHYLANVLLIDDWVGRLVEAAEKRFGDNLIVLVTADHGDLLGDHRLWAKNRCAYDPVLRIPFLLRLPNGERGGTSAARITLCDLLPTLAGYAGLETPPNLDGRPIAQSLGDGGPPMLFSSSEQFFVAHDRTGKLILDTAMGVNEYYDLEQDPGEFHNAIAEARSAPSVVRVARAAAEELVKTALR